MDILKFARAINSESDAIRFLDQCSRKHHLRKSIQCLSCRSKKYYIMNKGYARCQRCLADYNPFSNTQFGVLRISYTKWLTIIKLFDLGISARRAAREAGLSYPTALKAFDTIRYSILHHLAESDKVLNGEIEADEAYFGGKRKKTVDAEPKARPSYLASWKGVARSLLV
ncbi:MAG: hypothetical protein QXY15_08765 [Candidatus Nitrosotenuis sp.]